MVAFYDTQAINQLEKRRGGYFYVTVSAATVETLTDKRNTRLCCTIDGKLRFQCGLNHLGDGNFFIILGGKNLKSIGKGLGDTIDFELTEDPDPMGVPVPEVLEVLLAQDAALKATYDQLSMGKKRHVIHTIARIKDLDKQISNAVAMIQVHAAPRRRK